MASMSDLVFLLLIFFLITSTLVSTSALNLTLPHESANVRLETDKNVAVQHIVSVIDAVNTINKVKEAQHKVILATSPKRDR